MAEASPKLISRVFAFIRYLEKITLDPQKCDQIKSQQLTMEQLLVSIEADAKSYLKEGRLSEETAALARAKLHLLMDAYGFHEVRTQTLAKALARDIIQVT